MYDLNYLTLIGRLTRDPELRYTPSGNAVCSFSIANNPTGDKELVFFYNAVAWGKLAETVNDYFKKGKQICIEGQLRQRIWKTKDGENRRVPEILCEKIHFIDASNKQANQNTKPNVSNNQNYQSNDDIPY